MRTNVAEETCAPVRGTALIDDPTDPNYNPDQLLDSEEAGALLNVNSNRVGQLVRSNELAIEKKIGPNYVFRMSVVVEFRARRAKKNQEQDALGARGRRYNLPPALV